MVEMIIPGTYIDVRAEGLISAGRVATGIVGVLGTAASGPIDEPVTLSGFGGARDLFGVPDDFAQPQDGQNPLTLVRALQLIYGNGASTVVAVRVAGSAVQSAGLLLTNSSGDPVLTLTAKTPGSWADELQAEVVDAPQDCRIRGETLTGGQAKLRYAPILPSPENQIRLQRGATRTTQLLKVVTTTIVRDEAVATNQAGTFVLARTPVVDVAALNEVQVLESGEQIRAYRDPNIRYGAGAPPTAGEIRIVTDTGEITFEAGEKPTAAQRVVATYAVGHAAPQAGEVLITLWDGTLSFAAGAGPDGAAGDQVIANYVVDRSACVQVQLTFDTVIERYVVPDGALLAQLITASSQLATAELDNAGAARQPRTGAAEFFGTGTNTPGNNGAATTDDDFARGLESLSNMLINIVHLAGQDAVATGSTLVDHLNATAETDLERIGVIGAPGSTVAEFGTHAMASDRVIVVAPGIAEPGGPTLPAAYAAAAVAGAISAAAPHVSLTNKVINVPALARSLNRGEQQQLIQADVLAIVDRAGFRVIKGVTSAGEGTAFSSIPIRRIIDFAKYGVRSAANSYIGRLNNSRVRGALKATLDAFLTRMVDDEMLTGYALEVSATRAQEIAGEVSVTMTLQPTFSIDFVRVTMILK